MEEKKNGVYTYCRKSTQYSTWSRQCFMNDAPCAMQRNILSKQASLHRRHAISAFVIMNFSGMSDVVYKWRLLRFIESLKDYLYLNTATDEIVCVAERGNTEALPSLEKEEGVWAQVEHIEVVRADSNTVSNYIMCNRICQQIQIADLVIVDVSIENANVFYEFGMAAAAGKLILPICFSKSFSQFSLPEGARECLEERRRLCEKESGKDHKPEMESFRNMVEHHIDCYPWRRKLFEYFGIRYRHPHSVAGYTNFKDIVNPLYGFRDTMYNRSPYNSRINRITGESARYDYHHDTETVGTLLYSRLSCSYGLDTVSGKYNTVVLYTMDGILNEEQAGQCIINFYRNMTAQIKADFCFCGDRIGVMGQAGIISDDPKDNRTGQKPLYRVDDIIRTAMNEASDEARKHLVKPGDYLPAEYDETMVHADSAWFDRATENTKKYVKKRCIPINSDEPIHVQELLYGVQKGILSDEMLRQKEYQNGLDYRHFFCLFHVTLHTLRYTNELVVDLSHNSLPALFWLGVAHGSNVPAITVRHIPTKEELRLSGTTEPAESRSIFDVEGLSTVVLHSNDIAGFFNQLAKAQISIDQHRKLALSSTEMERFREGVLNASYDASPFMYGHMQHLRHAIDAVNMQHVDSRSGESSFELYKMLDLIMHSIGSPGINAILKTLSARSQNDYVQLESYYRQLFWERMLCCNELKLYTSQHDGFDRISYEPRRINLAWDTNAAVELSCYISKHAPNGNSRIHMLRQYQPDPQAHQCNFICIGGETIPLSEPGSGGLPLVRHIRSKIPESGKNVVRHLAFCKNNCDHAPGTDSTSQIYRGFFSQDGTNNVFAQFANARCIGNLVSDWREGHFPVCEKFSEKVSAEYVPIKKHFQPVTPNTTWEETGKGTFELPPDIQCQLCQNDQNTYDHLAQMILWREVPENPNEQTKYWGSLIGVSGPATLALTSLLVDDQQKRALFCQTDENVNPTELPLNDLQTQIRESLMEHYEKVLIKQLGESGLSSLCRKVCYATKLYLSTVLYQYFFPFLSNADEKQICNCMHTFVSSVGFVELFPEDHLTIADAVTTALRETISSFLGVEVLYTVEVEYGDKGKDDRKPKDIHLLRRDLDNPGDGKGEPMISCLFKDA